MTRYDVQPQIGRAASLFVALVCHLGLIGHEARAADAPPLITNAESKGYVSLPLTGEKEGKLQFVGKIHGVELNLVVDLGSGNSIFDKRVLDKIGVALQKTKNRLSAGSSIHYIYTARIIGLEVAERSTGPLDIFVANLDSLFAGSKGGGPDGIIALDLLTEMGAVIDLKARMLYLNFD